MKRKLWFLIVIFILLGAFLYMRPIGFEKIILNEMPTYVYASQIEIISGQNPYKLKEISSKDHESLWNNVYEQLSKYDYMKSSNVTLGNNQIEIYVTYKDVIVKISVDENDKILLDDGNKIKEYSTFGKDKNLYENLLQVI